MARNVQLSISLHNLLLTPEMRVAVVIVNAGHPASRERDDTDEAVTLVDGNALASLVVTDIRPYPALPKELRIRAEIG